MDEFESVKRKRHILKDFIQTYESFPCLWNVKSKEYHDRNMRTRAYKILAKKLQQLQPGADRAAVVRKINCLRSNLRKEMRKTMDYLRAGRVYRPKLWYYSLFNFLNDVSRKANNESEGVEGTDIKLEEIKAIDPLKWSCNVDEEPNEDDVHNDESTQVQLNESYEIDPPNVPEPGPSKPRLNYEDLQTSYRATRSKDRHDVFGKNVAMKLRHISLISDTQRLMAEKIINEALNMAEMGLLTPTHCKVLQ